MKQMGWKNVLLYVIVFVLVWAFALCIMVRIAYGQETECILVYNDDDIPGYTEEFSYTDAQGREVCKVRVVFHDPAPGDPTGAVWTESGEVNGYTANFSGASVHVWRTGSPYYISHTKVWVTEQATPPPPDTATPTVPDTATPEVPPDTATPTVPPETQIPPTVPPTVPPWITVTATPTETQITPGLPSETPPAWTPTVTPDYPPGTTPPAPGVTPVLPQTGESGTPNYSAMFALFFVVFVIFVICIGKISRRNHE